MGVYYQIVVNTKFFDVSIYPLKHTGYVNVSLFLSSYVSLSPIFHLVVHY